MPGRSAELVVWDFDGTLADTRTVIVNSFTQVFAERGLGACDTVALQRLIGLPLIEAFARMTGVTDRRDLDEFVGHYRDVFATRVATESNLFDGVAEVLDAAVASGRACAIATSRGRVSLEQMVDQFGIADRFVAVVCDEDVTNPKPHPEMVQRISGLVGVAPERALLVGDTTFDLAMGREAGAVTCGVTWGNQSAALLATEHPDHLVDTVDELARLVGTPPVV